MAVFEECRDQIAEVGSGFISRWSDTKAARGPVMLDSKISKEGEDLVRDVLEDIRKYGKSSVLAEKRNEVVATIACPLQFA